MRWPWRRKKLRYPNGIPRTLLTVDEDSRTFTVIDIRGSTTVFDLDSLEVIAQTGKGRR